MARREVQAIETLQQSTTSDHSTESAEQGGGTDDMVDVNASAMIAATASGLEPLTDEATAGVAVTTKATGVMSGELKDAAGNSAAKSANDEDERLDGSKRKRIVATGAAPNAPSTKRRKPNNNEGKAKSKDDTDSAAKKKTTVEAILQLEEDIFILETTMEALVNRKEKVETELTTIRYVKTKCRYGVQAMSLCNR